MTTYYLYLSETRDTPVRRTIARADSKQRVLELVYEKLPSAIIYKIGETTDVEDQGSDLGPADRAGGS